MEHAEKKQSSQRAQHPAVGRVSPAPTAMTLIDNRPEAIAQRKLADTAIDPMNTSRSEVDGISTRGEQVSVNMNEDGEIYHFGGYG